MAEFKVRSVLIRNQRAESTLTKAVERLNLLDSRGVQLEVGGIGELPVRARACPTFLMCMAMRASGPLISEARFGE